MSKAGESISKILDYGLMLHQNFSLFFSGTPTPGIPTGRSGMKK